MIAVFAEIQDMLYDVVEEAEDMIKIVMTTLLGDSSMAPELTSYLDFMSDLPGIDFYIYTHPNIKHST